MYVIFQFRSPRRSSTSTKKVAIQFLIGRNITKYCVSNLLLYKALVLKQYVQAKKENSPLKNSSYFEKWNFIALILKNLLYFLIFWETEIFSPSGNMELSNSNIKKFMLFRETKTLKKLFIFFQKKAFLIFPETKNKKNPCISRNRTFFYFGRNIQSLKNQKLLYF